jgi:hypothetical protein
MPQLPQILLILILIVVLGWGIILLMLLHAFRAYIEKTNKVIDKLYNDLKKSDTHNEWLQEELSVGNPTLPLPLMDIDNIY